MGVVCLRLQMGIHSHIDEFDVRFRHAYTEHHTINKTTKILFLWVALKYWIVHCQWGSVSNLTFNPACFFLVLICKPEMTELGINILNIFHTPFVKNQNSDAVIPRRNPWVSYNKPDQAAHLAEEPWESHEGLPTLSTRNQSTTFMLETPFPQLLLADGAQLLSGHQRHDAGDLHQHHECTGMHWILHTGNQVVNLFPSHPFIAFLHGALWALHCSLIIWGHNQQRRYPHIWIPTSTLSTYNPHHRLK